ncbi:MAG: hypothetical protein IAG10_29825, partial [Planctomycetaceae bacterium]|nr:hypothetical protein [Planctomycetaceae bacterium]
MFYLTNNDLHQLRGAGGERFADFVNRLLYGHAHACRLPLADVKTQLRVNVKDGGVDAQLDKPLAGDVSGWFGSPTVWQFKSCDGKDIDDSQLKPVVAKTGAKKAAKKSAKNAVTPKLNELQREITKPAVAALIRKGYGYRFCILGDLTPPKASEWESQLLAEAVKINPSAIPPKVVHGADIVQWAIQYPGLVCWMKNVSGKFLNWDAWQQNCRAITAVYVPDTGWDATAALVRQHIAFNVVPQSPCISIYAASGVGKTRFVHETIASTEGVRGLVVYTQDEDEAEKLACELARESTQTAILVADECGLSAQIRLESSLRGHAGRVRVICIDNDPERPSRSMNDRWLNTHTTETVARVMEVNFPDVLADHRRSYVELSKGFIRLAADLCQNDNLITAGGLLSGVSPIETYVRDRLGPDDLKMVALVGLFRRIGFRDEAAGELMSICHTFGVDEQKLRDAIDRVREVPGFVAQAGRYWYITPEIVATILFDVGYRTWLSDGRLAKVLELPKSLLDGLLREVAHHGKQEVRTECDTFFREWFLNVEETRLQDRDVAELIGHLLEIDPTRFLPRLRTRLETISLDTLAAPEAGLNGGRRQLVWALERLAWFSDWFPDCEACLYRLARSEIEPNLGNNATQTWRGLFPIWLPGTSAGFASRIEILTQRFSTATEAEAPLLTRAIQSVLSYPGARMMPPQVVAGRLRPEPWHPADGSSARSCLLETVSLAFESIRSKGAVLRDQLLPILLESLSRMIEYGLHNEMRELFDQIDLSKPERVRLFHVLREHSAFRKSNRQSVSNNDEDAAVAQWLDSIRPMDFSSQIHELCCRDPWDECFGAVLGSDIEEIVQRAIAQPELLIPVLEWMDTPEAQAANRLGFAIAVRDEEDSLVRIANELAKGASTGNFLKGYIAGVVRRGVTPKDAHRAIVERVIERQPAIGVDLLVTGGDAFGSISKLIIFAAEKNLPFAAIFALVHGFGNRELTPEEFHLVIGHYLARDVADTKHNDFQLLRFAYVSLLRAGDERNSWFAGSEDRLN